MDILELLRRPFPLNQIHWRVGATNVAKDGSLNWGNEPLGVPLAYIDARDVMDRLDDVCGENWQDSYPFEGCCQIGIKLNGEWIWRSNGAGQTDYEGEKGQYSDAFKRAAVLWGIGRYLYGAKMGRKPIKKQGRTWVFDDSVKESITNELGEWQKRYFAESNHRFKPGEKAEVYKSVMDYMISGDEVGVKEVMDGYKTPEEQMKFWSIFNSSERRAMKELLTDD